jgi:hypothetical protein
MTGYGDGEPREPSKKVQKVAGPDFRGRQSGECHSVTRALLIQPKFDGERTFHQDFGD